MISNIENNLQFKRLSSLIPNAVQSNLSFSRNGPLQKIYEETELQKQLPLRVPPESILARPETNSIVIRGQRKLKLITGRVDFAIKMNKFYPEVEGLYEIYGKIVKLRSGKIKSEHLILIRSEFGPLLQCVFYDCFNQKIEFEEGSNIRCIGRFKHSNRFHIFKIKTIKDQPDENIFARIQNVNSFSLSNK